MAKVELNSLKSVELEKKLGKTIYNSNKKVMDEYIMNNFKNDGHFDIPVIQKLVDEKSKLGKQLIDLYNRKVMLDDNTYISNEMKILQASAFDGLVVGVNVENGEWGIYTANTGVIFGLDTENKFNIGKTVELNEQGIVNAVRVDVTYTSEEGFEFKPVSLNKNTNLSVVDFKTGKGRFVLVPYIAIQRSMAFFKEYLDDGRTLQVVQEVSGMTKVRYISSKGSELAKYSDSEEFAKSLKPEYFPLKGFFYAPVLGASSMSIGRTRVDLVNVSNISSVSNPKVQKAEDGLKIMLIESTIQKVLTEIYNADEGEYSVLVKKFPKFDETFDAMNDCPSPVTVMKYYHQLKGKDLNKFHDVLFKHYPDLLNEVVESRDMINKCEHLDPKKYSVNEVRNMLKDGIYKFIIRKKDCEYSSLLVTNNEEYLKKMYGKNYFGLYESLGAKLYKLEELLAKKVDMVEALKYCGLPSGADVCGAVMNVLEKPLGEGESTHSRLADIFRDDDAKGKGVRKSSSNGEIILARKCFASLSNSGSVDYYRYLDMSKVVSMVRVG